MAYVLGYFAAGGYFDGDGCATFSHSKRKNRLNPALILSIRFRCGSKNFIEPLRGSLIKVSGVSKGSLSFYGGAYSLAYSAKDVVKLFGFMYPNGDIPYLERKFRILKEGLEVWGRSSVG